MSDAKAEEVALCVSTPRVTGADIPEELFEHILWHVVNGRIPDLPSPHPVVRAFTSLILVCRYFANICRPRLYREVVLQSRRHLERLLGLLRSGCTPFGKFLLEFTQDFEINDVRESETEGIADKDLSWIYQLGTTLRPLLENAGIRIPDVALRMHTDPVFRQLPRTVPPSTFQHVRSLELCHVQFQRGDDLLRCILSFRNLNYVRLSSCSYEPVTPPTAAAFRASRANRRRPEVDLWESDTLFPLVITEQLAQYAKTTSIASLSRGHEEARILTDIMSALSLELDSLLLRWGTDRGGVFGPIQVHAAGFFERVKPSVRALVQIQILDTTHYDILLEILPCCNPTKWEPMIKAWREIASSIARLSHLNTLKWSFRRHGSLKLMENFVKAVHPTLQELNAAGKTMKFKAEDQWEGVWESTSTILERYPPDPKVEASAEDQETEVTDEEAEDDYWTETDEEAEDDSESETDNSTEPIESAGTPADDAAVAWLIERLDLCIL